MRFEPMTDRTWIREDGKRRQSQFRVDGPATLAHLRTEIGWLTEDRVEPDLVVELAVSPEQLRRDRTGVLANVYIPPPVVVSFETRHHGRLVYRADALRNDHGFGMHSWRHNVRAVGATLEALRAVDRHGAQSGAQYAGYKALPAGIGLPASRMTLTEAGELLERVAIGSEYLVAAKIVAKVISEESTFREVLREAQRISHPDASGDRRKWDEVNEAGDLIRRTRGWAR